MEPNLEPRLTRLERMFSDLLLRSKLEDELIDAQENETDKLEEEHEAELDEVDERRERLQSRHLIEMEELAEKHEKEMKVLFDRFPELLVKSKSKHKKKRTSPLP